MRVLAVAGMIRSYSSGLDIPAQFHIYIDGLFSCGMDACEHEYPSMQRHGRKVPTSLYYRFTMDACKLAKKYAQGRLISVLEGGYSDRALISGTMAHICGLYGDGLNEDLMNKGWWTLDNLEKVDPASELGLCVILTYFTNLTDREAGQEETRRACITRRCNDERTLARAYTGDLSEG